LLTIAQRRSLTALTRSYWSAAQAPDIRSHVFEPDLRAQREMIRTLERQTLEAQRLGELIRVRTLLPVA
jgi:hypothetical protein